MLKDKDRLKLDSIVMELANQNAPIADVQAIVEDFKSKYDVPEQQPQGQRVGNIQRAVFPLSSMVTEGMKPGIGRTVLSNLAVVPDLVSSPFRALDEGVQAGSKILNPMFGIKGSWNEGKEQVANLIPGNNIVSRNLRSGVDMALSPSSYVGGGMIKKLTTAPEKILAQKLEKELVAKPLTLKDIRKGANATVETPAGEVATIGTPPKQGLPFVRDLDVSERRIMAEQKAEGTIDFGEYAKQAEIKKRDLKQREPFELAGMNFKKAFDEVNQIKKQAGKDIENVINTNKDVVVDISDVKDNFLQLVNDRLGEIKKGAIASDKAGAKEAEEIANELLNLPNSISAKDAINLKRNLQNRVNYTAEGQLKPVNSVLDGIVKNTAGSLDGKLDNLLDGYKAANEKYSTITNTVNDASRRLGKEINTDLGLTKHGASVMKRAIESNADSGIKELFRMIKEQTNGKYDLFQDAAYASIAMKNSGDLNQVQKAISLNSAVMGAKGGGDISAAVEKGLNVAKGIREKTSGGKLQRVNDWYNKQQKKYVTLGDLSKGGK
jgi:hypothetical protein